LSIFKDIVEGEFGIVRILEDEEGLYILDIKALDSDGDMVQYIYTRAGSYQEGSSLETKIDVVFYSDGVPCGGHSVKKYKGGVWV
jgi:hypothetical protein